MVAESFPENQQDKVWWVDCEQKKMTSDLLMDYTVDGNDCKVLIPTHRSIHEDNSSLLSEKAKQRAKYCEMAPSVICSVKRMQKITRILALVTFIPGAMFLTATPCMVIPIFVFPTGNKSLFVNLMLAEWCAAIVLITIGTIITNLHWYYDFECQRLRCTLRCHQKYKFRFWGSSSFSYQPFDDAISSAQK